MALRGEHVFGPGEMSEMHKTALGLPPEAWYIVLNPDRSLSYFLDRRGDMHEQTLPEDAPLIIAAAVRARPVRPASRLPYRLKQARAVLDTAD